jgi:amidase
LSQAVTAHGLLASPTIETLTPSFQEYRSRRIRLSRFTSPVNLAGLPAVVIPVPSAKGLPASLQLIGPSGTEDLLLATAGVVERSLTHSHLSGKH